MNKITTINGNSDVINYANELALAKYDIDITSSDILFSLVSQIHKDDKEFKIYEISVKDIEEMTGFSLKYSSVKKAGQILKLPFLIEELGTKNYDWASFLATFKYKNGAIFASFDPLIKPYLLNLKGSFSKFSFFYELAKLRNTKTRRLFIFLNSKDEDKGWRFNNLNEIYDTMNIEGKAREDFAYFNRKYLKKAVDDINEHTSLNISFEAKRKQRKIYSLFFKIEKDDTHIKAIKEEKKIESVELNQSIVLNPELDEVEIVESEMVEVKENTELFSLVPVPVDETQDLSYDDFVKGIEMINEVITFKQNRMTSKSKILPLYFEEVKNMDVNTYLESIINLIKEWKYPTFPNYAQFREQMKKVPSHSNSTFFSNQDIA